MNERPGECQYVVAVEDKVRMGERGQVSKAILSTTACWLYPLQASGSQCVESGPAAASFALEIIRSANH